MTTVEKAPRSPRRRTVLAMAICTAAMAGSAGAARASDLVDLTVVDRETGQPLREWRHDGRTFVIGRPGARYGLRVSNHSDGRVLVVMSVDGLNVLTGETAGYGQRGYVFEPHQSYDVTGWRKSDTEVAAFTFAPLPQSYAARTGRPQDIGVIGVAAFRERIPVAVLPVSPAWALDRRAGSNSVAETVVGQRAARAPAPPPAAPPASARLAAPAPSAAAPADSVVTSERREDKLGTAHGAREWSVVTLTPFERATAYPQLVRRIEYDSYDNLLALGVLSPPRDFGRPPRPFPNSGGGYVPDPPGEP